MTFQSVKRFFNTPILNFGFFPFVLINISLGLMVAGIYVLFGIDLDALTGWFNLFGPALVANVGIIYCLILGDDTKSWFRRKLSPYWNKFKRKAGIREVQTDEDTDNYLLRLGLDKPVQRIPMVEMETVLVRPLTPPRSHANTSRTGPPLRNYNSEYDVNTDTITIPREMAEELGLIQSELRVERGMNPRPTTVRIERVTTSHWTTSDEIEEESEEE